MTISEIADDTSDEIDDTAELRADETASDEDDGASEDDEATDEDDGENGKEARVTFTADPGVLARFGPIEIAGNKSVGDSVIRRHLTIRPGDPYRRSVIQDTQRRLYAMELFQFVSVSAADPEQQVPDVPMRVTVAEGKHQRVNGCAWMRSLQPLEHSVGEDEAAHLRQQDDQNAARPFGGRRAVVQAVQAGEQRAERDARVAIQRALDGEEPQI